MRTLLVLFLFAQLGVQAQEFLEETRMSGPRVFLFAEDFYSRAQVKVKQGSYLLKGYNKDSTYVREYGPDDVHPLYTFRAELMINRTEFDSITFYSNDTIVLRVLQGGKWTEERPYIGKLTLRNNLIYIDAIARCSMEDYLAGVVEAEGGLAGRGSYLQAQAVLARTWLMSNDIKHIKEGFHVKDDQSSQAFKGVAHGGHAQEVMKAVLSVQDTVALYNGKPIIGFYHSNSGGQTVLPQEVWSQALPYCRKVVDPFSLKGSKLNWTQSHTWEEWNGYWTRIYVDLSEEEWGQFFQNLPSDCRIGPLAKKNTSWKPLGVRSNGAALSCNVKPRRRGWWSPERALDTALAWRNRARCIWRLQDLLGKKFWISTSRTSRTIW